MVIKFRNSYPCIYGLPVIHSVDTDIFDLTYFMHCMQCTFCKDQCCEWGTDIDLINVERIMKYKKELEEFTGYKSDKWLDTNIKKWDHEYPGGDYTRTSIIKEKKYCVFLDIKNRGCMLHSFAQINNIVHYKLKPFFCSMFPVTYDESILTTPEEIDEMLTVCLGAGLSLYSGARNAIRYYFGDGIIRELDEIEKRWKAESAGNGSEPS